MTAPIRSQSELLDAIRARRDELNISHETIDNIAGFQAGYTSKLLCDPPMKNPGPMSLGALLGALGMALMPIEDDAAISQVAARWVKRKRPQRLVEPVPVSQMPPYRKINHVKLRSQRMSAARKKGRHSSAEWEALVLACGSMCVRCRTDGPVQKDHIEPIYAGGSDGLENLQPLCASCNSSKGPENKDHRPLDWPEATASILAVSKPRKTLILTAQLRDFAGVQMWGQMGGMKSGKKRRAKAMRRRALQQVRAHAARMRWSKTHAT